MGSQALQLVSVRHSGSSMSSSIWCFFLSLSSTAFCMPQGGPPETKCQDYVDFGYFCVPYYQCTDENKINVDGVDLFDPRQVDGDISRSLDPNLAITSKCGKLLEVCCQHPDNARTNEVVEDDLSGGDDDYVDDDDDNIFGGDYPEGVVTNIGDGGGGTDEDIFGEDSPGQCGKRNSKKKTNLNSSVKEAEFGEWPHVCAVLKKEYIGENDQLVKVYHCGASLISAGVVLTAGHCLNDTNSLKNKLVVRCGEWDTQTTDEEEPFQERNVDKMELHPDFNVDNHHNNFGLLFLESDFSYSSHISPVCLPRPGLLFGGENCVSHGWGKDKFGAEGRYSTILKEVVIPLVENKKCEKLLRENTRLGAFFELDSSFICAGGQKGIDTCRGDGGSPLTCRNGKGPWFQAGIVSWGIGCGETNTPAVYASVTKASCWIDSAVTRYMGKTDSFFGFTTEDCP